MGLSARARKTGAQVERWRAQDNESLLTILDIEMHRLSPS
jgi:hypothetical protein